MALPNLVGRLVGDVSDFGRSMGSVAGLVGGAFAAVGAVKFMGGALEEMEEAQKVGKQTAAVIKSTGGVAKVSAKDIDSLATELSNLAGIDDEVIASSQNVLLTFTQVRNEVGKGNDVFNQASKAALNMSVAMGSDLQTATVQVGKALNDPIKGVAALRKVGVQLTEQQEESIKTMMEQGNVMGAQKLILGELETQFGGSAEAQATASAKMRVAWGNLQESAGKALAPLMEAAANVFPKVLSGVEGIAGNLSTRFAPAWKEATGGFQAFIAAFKAGDGDVTSSGFPGAMERIAFVVRQVVDRVREEWPRIREIISEVLTTVQSVIAGVVDAIMVIWNNFGSQIVAVLQSTWDFVMAIVDAAMNVIRGIIDVVAGLISGDWSRVWEGIKSIFSGVWDAMMAIVEFATSVIREVISVAWEIVKGIVTGAWDAIKNAVSAGINAVIDLVASLPGRALSALGDLGSLLFNAGKRLLMGFVDGIVSVIGTVKDTLTGLVGKLTSWKGPPAKDARLLFGAGQLVMGGFDAGLQDGIPGVKSTLSGLTSMMGSPSMGSAPHIGGGAAGGTTVVLVIGDKEFARVMAPANRDALIDLGRHLPGGAFGAAA